MLGGYIDRSEGVVGNMVCGLFLKMVLVCVLSLESVILQLASERKINETRKQFLRYVFHEVRVPLSTITMGISVLKDDARYVRTYVHFKHFFLVFLLHENNDSSSNNDNNNN